MLQAFFLFFSLCASYLYRVSDRPTVECLGTKPPSRHFLAHKSTACLRQRNAQRSSINMMNNKRQFWCRDFGKFLYILRCFECKRKFSWNSIALHYLVRVSPPARTKQIGLALPISIRILEGPGLTSAGAPAILTEIFCDFPISRGEYWNTIAR